MRSAFGMGKSHYRETFRISDAPTVALIRPAEPARREHSSESSGWSGYGRRVEAFAKEVSELEDWNGTKGSAGFILTVL